jgi:E3 ubiquitin-protein ligase DOA10
LNTTIDDESNPEVTGKYQRLLNMDFMKKAASMQREKAREEAQLVLQELRSLEEQEGNTSDEGNENDEKRNQSNSKNSNKNKKLISISKDEKLKISKELTSSDGSMTISKGKSKSLLIASSGVP